MEKLLSKKELYILIEIKGIFSLQKIEKYNRNAYQFKFQINLNDASLLKKIKQLLGDIGKIYECKNTNIYVVIKQSDIKNLIEFLNGCSFFDGKKENYFNIWKKSFEYYIKYSGTGRRNITPVLIKMEEYYDLLKKSKKNKKIEKFKPKKSMGFQHVIKEYVD